MERRLGAEQESSAGAEDSLRQRLVGVEDALKATESALDLRKEQLAYSEKTVARLDADAAKLRERITKLEQGVIGKNDLMDELRESRSEVEHLRGLVEDMKPAANDKSRLEEELSVQREQLDTLEMENEDLRQELQGKFEALEACKEAKDSAQKLADECNAELAQKRGELENAHSLHKRTEKLYNLTVKRERKYRSDYNAEVLLRQATYNVLTVEQEKVKSKDEEIRGLQDSIKSKEEEIRGLQGSMESKGEEIGGLQDQIKSKDDEVRGLQGSMESKETEVQGLQDSITSKEEEIRGLQDLIRSKYDEVRGLQGSMESKDDEIRGLQDQIKSKDETLRLVNNDLEQLTYQIRDRDEQLQSQNKSVAQLQADLADVGREKGDAELDLGFIFRLSSLSIRIADVGLPQWTPLLRSLRVSDPVEITPEEDMARQTWSILPSWPGSGASVGAGSVSDNLPCLHASLDSLLLELYGRGMSEGGFPCDPCLRALCTLSAAVERQGVAEASSLVLVLQKLEARLRDLEATSGYEGMVMLGLRYLAALVRPRVPGGDVPGLSAVEDSLDGMLEQADKCPGVIRRVSDDLCSSGGIENVEANHGLRVASQEGRVLVLLPDSERPDELFLLADPEDRTVRAVSFRRLDRDVRFSKAGELVNSATIKSPAGQPDIELDLTAAEAGWIRENL